MNDLIISLAARYDGSFTRHEALTAGMTAKELRTMLASGEIRRLERGVFALGPPLETREAEHAFAARSVSRAYDGQVIASHHSSLLLAGLPVHAVPLRQLRFQRSDQGRAITTPTLRISRPTIDLPKTRIGGVPAIDPAYAVGQVAAEYGVYAGIVAADQLIDHDPDARERLWDCHRLMARCRGRANIPPVAFLADPSSESPAESILRVILVAAGIAVTPQFEVREGRRLIARADFRVDGTAVLIEFDGEQKYTDRSVNFAEKKRADALGRRGWIVVRVIWADLADPVALVRRIEAESRGQIHVGTRVSSPHERYNALLGT